MRGRIGLVIFFLIWCTGFAGGFVGGFGYGVLRPSDLKPQNYNYPHDYDDRADISKVDYRGVLQKTATFRSRKRSPSTSITAKGPRSANCTANLVFPRGTRRAAFCPTRARSR
ncbi:MAG: hypothetical protein LBL66_01870 [Clostridiales bacterium]|jgi:hypothetical protein|nr:hypothetical protein [Clostridiales bacterium]